MIRYLVVHCSASPQGRGDSAETIHRWHQQRGWAGIGYHAVILEDGTVENGRPLYWRGAHVRGHNHESLGACLIGEGGDATEGQLASLRRLLDDWQTAYPGAEVVGHRDLDPHKTCPGFDAPAWYNTEG